MNENYSGEFGKEINNRYWKDGRHIYKSTLIENLKGEGYKFYSTFNKNNKNTIQILNGLRKNPNILNLKLIDKEQEMRVYVLYQDLK